MSFLLLKYNDMPEERMMRDENVKSVKTEYMSYDEWKKKYVAKVDEMGYNISEEYIQEQVDFIDKYTNEKVFIPKNTIINKSKSLANGTEIRDLKRLLNNYGGNPDDWSKKFGMVKSAKYKYDIHWYEKHGKQYELKFKNRKEI